MLQQTTAINSCDIHHYCSVATRILQLCTRKESFIFAICLTAASPWPRKATHGCFHIAAWYRTKSDRHVFRRILLKPKKMNRTDYRLPGTDVPTKKIKCVFQRKMNSNNPHVHIYDIIHLSLIHISEPTRLGMISYAVFCLKKKNVWYQLATTRYRLKKCNISMKNQK